MAAGGGRAGDRRVLRLGSGGPDRREGGLAIRWLHPVAGALPNRPGQLPMPHHRGDPQGGVRAGGCARQRALGCGAHHGNGDRRGGPARLPPGGLGRGRRPRDAGKDCAARPARARACAARGSAVGAARREQSRSVPARPCRRRPALSAVPGQRGTDRRLADEDLRSSAACPARRGDRRRRVGAQLPRRHGDARAAAGAGLRALCTRPRGRHGGERRGPPRRHGGGRARARR